MPRELHIFRGLKQPIRVLEDLTMILSWYIFVSKLGTLSAIMFLVCHHVSPSNCHFGVYSGIPHFEPFETDPLKRHLKGFSGRA